jgi:hypothetical protein
VSRRGIFHIAPRLERVRVGHKFEQLGLQVRRKIYESFAMPPYRLPIEERETIQERLLRFATFHFQ